MIDFSVMSALLSAAFDSDLMDIGRRGTITIPPGVDVETDPDIPLYVDVPCHVEYVAADNPDVANEPTKPIIMSLKIHAGRDVDVKNGDYITVRKRSASGEVLEIYKGIAAEPSQYQSRTAFAVGIRKNV